MKTLRRAWTKTAVPSKYQQTITFSQTEFKPWNVLAGQNVAKAKNNKLNSSMDSLFDFDSDEISTKSQSSQNTDEKESSAKSRKYSSEESDYLEMYPSNLFTEEEKPSELFGGAKDQYSVINDETFFADFECSFFATSQT